MRGKKGKGNIAVKKRMGRPPKEPQQPEEIQKVITKFGDGSIISLFDKTPEPQNLADIICPHFWELKYANGCHFDCEWCYLNGTFRFKDTGKEPYLKDSIKTIEDLELALQTLPPTVFNAGELSDALVYEGTIINTIVPLFKKYADRQHKLLLLTKSMSKMSIAACAYAKDQIIFAYSINAREVAATWETDAPTALQRLEAAKTASDYGYEVRIRLDPMVPVNHWEDGYREIIQKIIEFVPKTTIITLGSLRGLKSTLIWSKKLGNDMSWTEYLKEDSRWGKRPLHATRLALYKFAIDELKKAGFKGRIGICKETGMMFKDLGINPFMQTCNCTYLTDFVEQGKEEMKKKWDRLCSTSIDATLAEEESSGSEEQHK